MRNLRRTLKAVDTQALRLVMQGQGELLGITRSFLSHPGNGRMYRSRKPKGGWHQASAPGEPPAPDPGRYRSKVITVAGPLSRHKYYLGVGSTEPYARELEYGRTTPTFMAPRPHFRPAMRFWIATRYVPFARNKFLAAQRAAARGDRITLRMVGSQGQTRSANGTVTNYFGFGKR